MTVFEIAVEPKVIEISRPPKKSRGDVGKEKENTDSARRRPILHAPLFNLYSNHFFRSTLEISTSCSVKIVEDSEGERLEERNNDERGVKQSRSQIEFLPL
jgi:hypothetical protein